MPETIFTAELPDGSFQPCYSPTTIVRQFFRAGQELPARDFIRLSRMALQEAADRDTKQIGNRRANGYSSLPDIERWAGALPPDTPVLIFHVS